MKHEKPGYEAMLEAMQKALGDRCATTEQHRFAIEWLFTEHDRFERNVLERLAKLEALNPEVRTVIGYTASGCTVHGLGQTTPGEE